MSNLSFLAVSLRCTMKSRSDYGSCGHHRQSVVVVSEAVVSSDRIEMAKISSNHQHKT